MYRRPFSRKEFATLVTKSSRLRSKVDWLPQTGQVVITDGKTRIVLTIGSTEALVNGEKITLDYAPIIVPPGRTFVPLRLVSETLGAGVDYADTTGGITVTW